jgi:AraC-like DNA-binding protein
MVHYSTEPPKDNFSDYLSEKLECDYAKVSHLFSKTKGTTIEHFIILHKIERIKELILYDDLNLSEIADLMNYKSLSHLSKQFKQITGLTPTFFKNLPRKHRINLEDI